MLRLFELEPWNRLSTGLMSLDTALGNGLPRGGITEIYGEPGSGKTSLAASIIYCAQQQDNKVLLLDVDSSYTSDPVMKGTGVSSDKLYIKAPRNAEETISMVSEVIKTSRVDIIILDDIGSLCSEKEDMNDNYKHANQVFDASMRPIASLTRRHNVAFIIMNQLRTPSNKYHMNHITTAGGLMLRCYASRRVILSAGPNIEVLGNNIGFNASASVNKILDVQPWPKIDFSIYKFGIDFGADFINLCVKFNLINKTGGWFEINGIKLNGEKEFRQWLKNEPLEQRNLEVKLRKILNLS